MAKMRSAILTLIYKGIDISADVTPYLLSAEYTDNAEGKADDLQISLENRKGLWNQGWFPDKGARVEARLTCRHWKKPGATLSLDMGTFEIDEIEISGPPSIVTLKSVSSLVTNAFRNEAKSHAWENIRMDAIAGQIAETHGFQLFYDVDSQIEFQRKDQNNESDSKFLDRICKENGLAVKIAKGKMIIYEAKKYDARPAGFTLSMTGGEVISHRFSSKSHDIYKACRVDYKDPVTTELRTFTFSPPEVPPTGQTLKINKRAESLAAAQKIAMDELRNKNRNQFSGDLTVFGNPNLRAGLNIELTGFGIFDGRWHVEEAKHTSGTGYTTAATIRKVVPY